MRWILCSVFLLLSAVTARAHALDPGYLQMRELGGDSWQVFWRKPNVKDRPMQIDAVLPDHCTPARAPSPPAFDGAAWASFWVATCPGGIAGSRLTIEGLDATRTDTLVRIIDLDGAGQTARATPDATALDITIGMSAWSVFASYMRLGFEHILEGLDHLLFVFALIVLIRDPWRLAGAITAFTVAHSITLALATLDLIRVPSPPVEAIIALSIILLAVEILRRRDGQMQLTERYPWIISFSFGLLHGLGFAGALSEIGLPPGDIPLALLAFNLGVEAGQLTFVAAVLIGFAGLRLVWPRLVRVMQDNGSYGNLAMGYAIGGIATWWLAERLAGF